MNLRQKKYHILNKRYSPEEYEKIVKNAMESPEKIIEKFQEFKKTQPHQQSIQDSCENCEGDHLYNCQNCHYCFDSEKSKDSLYSDKLINCEDCCDVVIGDFSKWNYECVSSYFLHNSNFCYNCWESANLEYCEQCFQCQDCLFCVNLQHKQFHIFNIQYTKEEYLQKKSQIISEMKKTEEYGKFIGSTYPYEDTLAQEKPQQQGPQSLQK
ncbi:hypothetical protein KJ632_03430 [Patescibacteria group bacterium]|nr:hypothetical protein [Patescibacteria group bacterium]